MKNEDKEYIPLTHEELVLEVYNLMHKLPLEEQAKIAKKIREAVEDK